MPTTDLPYETCVISGQATDFEQVMFVGSDLVIKIEVHHDRSYANQSHATCSVWRPDHLDWSRLFRLNHAVDNWAKETRHHTPEPKPMTQGIAMAQAILVERAFDLLMD